MGTVNSGRGTLAGGTNPAGIEVAFDATNQAGITATSVAPAATATTGFEFCIPFADLGLPAGFAGSVSVAAFVQRGTGEVSNQWLPGFLRGGRPRMREPGAVRGASRS